MNIIEELYYENISPCDKRFNRPSEYANLMKRLSDNEQKLAEFLKSLPDSENEKHLLSQIVNAQSELSNFADTEKFIEGFQLGARFVLYTLVLPDNSVIRDITYKHQRNETSRYYK